ncbi:hypothetical protein ARMA_0665 [Ardenticatena maritima]|uniref:Uncharacterized protein n=1 Tax=Ardenticatena maritima TaxID=872965 RepID=A0A0M8K7D1_9CHLR|nr:MgtC/SapB family protein [Ardenticatena maritima]KPL86466.1 hypothetical protein SE16_14385 [Ardenticatena maritima]GAP62242.1 hypothetical protein ARMA_0665 [Ardenticatena maritima]
MVQEWLALIPNIDLWSRFALALALGALVGLEREYAQQHVAPAPASFAGIRTFPLIALLGALSAFTADLFDMPSFFAVGFGGLAVLVGVSYVRRLGDERGEGITTEVAILLTFLFGGLTYREQGEIASALTVIMTMLLSLRRSLHDLARNLTRDDLLATLQFALITVVILPLLPNRALDPFGVLNPYRIWLLVVFISGLSFGGYVAIKLFGAGRALWLMGLLGGIVSSTATTLTFAGRSHDNPALSPAFASAILLASTVVFPRTLILLALIAPELFWLSLPFLGSLFIVGLLTSFALMFWYRPGKEERQLQLQNPLNLIDAVKFAAMFTAVLFLVDVSETYFGNAGLYITSIIAGFTSTSATVLSLANLASLGNIPASTALIAILLAILSNILSKAFLAASLGARAMRRPVLLGFGIFFIANVIALASALSLAR